MLLVAPAGHSILSESPSLTGRGELKVHEADTTVAKINGCRYLGGYEEDTLALQIILCVMLAVPDSSIHITDERPTIRRLHNNRDG